MLISFEQQVLWGKFITKWAHEADDDSPRTAMRIATPRHKLESLKTFILLVSGWTFVSWKKGRKSINFQDFRQLCARHWSSLFNELNDPKISSLWGLAMVDNKNSRKWGKTVFFACALDEKSMMNPNSFSLFSFTIFFHHVFRQWVCARIFQIHVRCWKLVEWRQVKAANWWLQKLLLSPHDCQWNET